MAFMWKDEKGIERKRFCGSEVMIEKILKAL